MQKRVGVISEIIIVPLVLFWMLVRWEWIFGMIQNPEIRRPGQGIVAAVSNGWLRQRDDVLTVYSIKAYKQHFYQFLKCKSRNYRSVLFVLSWLYGDKTSVNLLRRASLPDIAIFFPYTVYLRFKLYKGPLQPLKGPQLDSSILSPCRHYA